MKKIYGVLLCSLCLLLFTGCTNESSGKSKSNDNNGKTSENEHFAIEEYEEKVSESAFQKEYPDYYLQFEKTEGLESVSITNYNPIDFANLPNYQEVIEYGNVSLSVDKIVYSVDIYINDSEQYYSAEFDGKTKELISEEGDWTPENEELEEFVNEKIEMIDFIIN